MGSGTGALAWPAAALPAPEAVEWGRVHDILVSMQSPETWVTLVTLATLEIVLGVDNIVFLAIMTQTWARAQRNR